MGDQVAARRPARELSKIAPLRVIAAFIVILCVSGASASDTALAARHLLEGAAPPTSQVLSTPSNCTGWPTKRVYLEGSAWYTRPGQDVDTQSARLHLGACVPHRQRVWGAIELHVLVIKANFPDLSTPNAPVDVGVNFSSLLGDKMRSRYRLKSTALRAPSAWDCSGDVCRAALALSIKTWTGSVRSASIPDGLTKMTITARAGGLADGKSKRALEARVDTFFVIDNRGKAAWPINQVLGVEQLSISDFPWGQTHAELMSDLPLTHVPASWVFDTKHFIYFRARRTSNVTRVSVALDPAWSSPTPLGGAIAVFEAAATQILDKCTLFKGMVAACVLKGLEVDTTQLLRGLHRLFIRTDSYVDPGQKIMYNTKLNGGTFSAGATIVFSVCNEDAATCAEPDPPAPGDRPPVPELPPIDPPNGTTWYRPTTPLPDPQAVINNSYECGGWAGTRVYLEAQTWFTRSARDPSAESTQLHVGACLPHKQKVAGIVPLDIVVGKHNFPSNANVNVNMRVSFIWQGGNTTLNIEEMDVLKGWGCNGTEPVCKRVYRSLIDTRPDSREWYLPDGLIRVFIWARLKVDDGVTTRWLEARVDSWMVLQNNVETDIGAKPLAPSAATRTIIPWKDTFTALTTELPLGGGAGPLAFGTKHWLSGRIGSNVTGIYVGLDPAFTEKPNPILGHVLLSVSSASDGSMISAPPANCTVKPDGDGGPVTCALVLDPAAVPFSCSRAALYNPCKSGLCDAAHRLFIRTDYLVAPDNPFFLGLPDAGKVGAGTLTTAVVVPLRTSNGNTPEPSACAPGAGVFVAAAAAAEAAPIDMVTTRVTLAAEQLPADDDLVAEMAAAFDQA